MSKLNYQIKWTDGLFRRQINFKKFKKTYFNNSREKIRMKNTSNKKSSKKEKK